MALDLDEMEKRFDNMLKDPKFIQEAKEYFANIERRGKIQTMQLKRFHGKYDAAGLDAFIEKCIQKYSSEKYKALWYEGRHQELPTELFWFLYMYGERYCKKCKDKKYLNMFTSGAYYVGSYVIQCMNGQGSVIRIDKVEK